MKADIIHPRKMDNHPHPLLHSPQQPLVGMDDDKRSRKRRQRLFCRMTRQHLSSARHTIGNDYRKDDVAGGRPNASPRPPARPVLKVEDMISTPSRRLMTRSSRSILRQPLERTAPRHHPARSREGEVSISKRRTFLAWNQRLGFVESKRKNDDRAAR